MHEENTDTKLSRETINVKDAEEAGKALATPAVRQLAKEKGVLCPFPPFDSCSYHSA